MGNIIGSNNEFPSILVKEGTTPASPSAGDQRLFVRSSDHVLCRVNSSGTVTPVEGLSNPMTTKGDVILGDTGGTPTRLAAGTSTYVLTSNGAGAFPSWQAPGGGGGGALVLLEQHTASSSATLDFTTFISSTYDTYMFKLVSVMPATSTADLWMRMGTGAGPTWDAGANYGSQGWRRNFSGTHAAFYGADSGANQILLAPGWLSAGNHPIVGTLDLFDPQSASLFKFGGGKLVYPQTPDGNMEVTDVGFQYNSATAVTGVRFLMSSGNIASGTIRVYGIAKV